MKHTSSALSKKFLCFCTVWSKIACFLLLVYINNSYEISIVDFKKLQIFQHFVFSLKTLEFQWRVLYSNKENLVMFKSNWCLYKYKMIFVWHIFSQNRLHQNIFYIQSISRPSIHFCPWIACSADLNLEKNSRVRNFFDWGQIFQVSFFFFRANSDLWASYLPYTLNIKLWVEQGVRLPLLCLSTTLMEDHATPENGSNAG